MPFGSGKTKRRIANAEASAVSTASNMIDARIAALEASLAKAEADKNLQEAADYKKQLDDARALLKSKGIDPDNIAEDFLNLKKEMDDNRIDPDSAQGSGVVVSDDSEIEEEEEVIQDNSANNLAADPLAAQFRLHKQLYDGQKAETITSKEERDIHDKLKQELRPS